MTMPLVDVSTGLTIGFGTSGFTAQILDVTPPPLTREDVDTTHQGTTGARTKMPVDLYESGDLEFDIHFRAGTHPPIDAAAEVVTLTFPSGTTWIFTGHFKSYVPTAPLEGKMTAHVIVGVSGTIVIDPEGAESGSSSVEV